MNNELLNACKRLVRLYIANLDSGNNNEFICCITPKHASDMTAKERKNCEVWAAWDAARKAIKNAEKSRPHI